MHGQEGVRITIADTGSGIPRERVGRTLELFYITRKDSGTGLGLWVSYGIVQKHSGTVFAIFLLGVQALVQVA